LNKFWQIKNDASQESAELLLYGDIASERPWWSEGDTTTPKEFASDLALLGGRPVTVRINSMGGDVFAAHAIYNQLRTYSGKVTVLIDSIAASAASIVAMAGNPVIMPSNTMMMIHKPMLELFGYYNTDDLSKMSTALDGIKESIVSAYMSKSNIDRKQISKMMDDATWMTADKAKECGLCDEVQDLGKALNAVINGNFMVVNSVRHDLGKAKNSEQLRQMVEEMSKKATTPPPQTPKESILDEAKKLLATAVNLLTPQNKHEEDMKLDIKNAEDLQKAHPDLVAQIVNKAVADAAANEAARPTALDALADAKAPNAAVDALIADAKNTGKTAENIKAAVDIMKTHAPAPKNKGEEVFGKMLADAAASGVDGVAAGAGAGTPEQREEAAAVNFMAGIIAKKSGGAK
jgi:ATP-dependent Clp protease protease subunit